MSLTIEQREATKKRMDDLMTLMKPIEERIDATDDEDQLNTLYKELDPLWDEFEGLQDAYYADYYEGEEDTTYPTDYHAETLRENGMSYRDFL